MELFNSFGCLEDPSEQLDRYNYEKAVLRNEKKNAADSLDGLHDNFMLPEVVGDNNMPLLF